MGLLRGLSPPCTLRTAGSGSCPEIVEIRVAGAEESPEELKARDQRNPARALLRGCEAQAEKGRVASPSSCPRGEAVAAGEVDKSGGIAGASAAGGAAARVASATAAA